MLSQLRNTPPDELSSLFFGKSVSYLPSRARRMSVPYFAQTEAFFAHVLSVY